MLHCVRLPTMRHPPGALATTQGARGGWLAPGIWPRFAGTPDRMRQAAHLPQLSFLGRGSPSWQVPLSGLAGKPHKPWPHRTTPGRSALKRLIGAARSLL